MSDSREGFLVEVGKYANNLGIKTTDAYRLLGFIEEKQAATKAAEAKLSSQSQEPVAWCRSDTVLNWKGQTINAAMMHPSPKGLLNPIPLYTSPQAQEAKVLQAEAQAVVGEVCFDGIGEQQVTAIKWLTDYRPKKGDKIYTSPQPQPDLEAKLLQAEARVKELENLISSMVGENIRNRENNSARALYETTKELMALQALSTQPSTKTLGAYVKKIIGEPVGYISQFRLDRFKEQNMNSHLGVAIFKTKEDSISLYAIKQDKDE